MLAASQSPRPTCSPRLAAAAASRAPARVAAARAGGPVVDTPAPVGQRELVEERSNIVDMPRQGVARRAALEAEVRAQLEAEHSWWRDVPGAGPANLRCVASKADFKQAIAGAPEDQLICVDYLKPSCGACRRMYPKLQQIAAQNPDVLVLKVNVDESEELAELGQGMGVTHLPHFHLFRAGQLAASFSANVTTISSLRAEIAAHKPCTDVGCAAH